MNLELHEYLYIIIGYLFGSLLAVIMAVERWGAPTTNKAKKYVAYLLVILTSWVLVLVLAVERKG